MLPRLLFPPAQPAGLLSGSCRNTGRPDQAEGLPLCGKGLLPSGTVAGSCPVRGFTAVSISLTGGLGDVLMSHGEVSLFTLCSSCGREFHLLTVLSAESVPSNVLDRPLVPASHPLPALGCVPTPAEQIAAPLPTPRASSPRLDSACAQLSPSLPRETGLGHAGQSTSSLQSITA